MTLQERYAAGKALRTEVPREKHAEWSPVAPRDAIALLDASNEGRVPQLVPIRFGRMLQSPFAFYRGAAAIMAADLATTPATGIRVQACGDCHLLNFGGFATPERRLIFDLNDFDETSSAPWEWDLKRLTTSFIVASRSNGFKAKQARAAAAAALKAYRRRIAEFAAMRTIEVWYASIDADEAISAFGDAPVRGRLRKKVQKLTANTIAEDDFPKVTRTTKGQPVIKDNPPLVYHLRDTDDTRRQIASAFGRYRETLPDDRRALLDRYALTDLAMKVVGVGSVGTRSAVLLLMASKNDSMFLQVKEARASVLEPYAGASPYSNRGQRIVMGQRRMQSATDVFLGWTEMDGSHFYVRQLRDMKVKPVAEALDPSTMKDYAALCGWALARAHAKSGDAQMISGYLGKKDTFDEALVEFAAAYADQNERDHAALAHAVKQGRVKAKV